MTESGKKLPLRRCIACREGKPKQDLIRIVRSPEGEVTADPTGKKNGRGAYICKSEACLTKAVKSKALERALKTSIGEECMERLREEVRLRDTK